MEYREVNGETLVPIEAYRLGDDYLITRAPGYPQWHVAHVTCSDGRDLDLELVDTWYDLPDAMQGALAHRAKRLEIMTRSVKPSCDHEWTAGMMHVHPEDLQGLIDAGRRLECTKCDETIN